MALDVSYLAIASGVVIPILVGVVTKMTASQGTKALANFTLAAVGGALAALVAEGTDINFETFIQHWVVVWVIDVSTYYGFLKPKGVTTLVQQKTASLGLGAKAA